MKIKDAVSELKKGDMKNYYLIAGTEEYLRELAVKSILPLFDIQMEEWNVSTIRNGEELKDKLEGLPMMSERRAVLCDIRDIQEQSAGRLASYLPNMPKSTVLILIKGLAPDKRKPLEKIFFEQGTVIECSEPTESETIDFLCGYAAKQGADLPRRDAHTFYRYVSGDLRHMVNELNKLVLTGGKKITKKDIEKYTVRSAEYNIFKLHDLFLEQRRVDARNLLSEILDEDSSPIGLISILASNFELMLIARACLDAGYREDKTKKNIMDAAKVAEFRARKAIAQSRAMSAPDIRRAIRKLSKLDFDAKQGNVVLKNDLYAVLMNIYTVS
jgi:DNA polymerase III delta subunit